MRPTFEAMEAPPGPLTHSVHAYATDLRAFVRMVVGRNAVLCGHSLGGMVALLVAASMPDLVRGLILVDVPFTLGPLKARLEQMPPEMPPEIPVDPSLHRVLREQFAAHYAGYVPEALAPQVVCPVLVLQADPARGGALSDADVARILPLFGQATSYRFAGRGHTIWQPQPDEMLRVLTGFLERLSDIDGEVPDSP